MSKIPAKVSARISAALKRFQSILDSAKARDVNESDTVVIVTDLLQEIFGYDKYSDITSEHMIRGTYCDLAIKVDGKLALLIEVKAIGLELKDGHVKQAVDYAANQGCDWVVLTNGLIWRVYKLTFSKPIESELVVEIDLSKINHKDEDSFESIWLISKEAWSKSHLTQFHSQRQIVNKFTIAAVILTEDVLSVIRREIRRLSSGVKLETEELAELLSNDVLKRDTLDGDKAAIAKRLVSRSSSKTLRVSKSEEKDEASETAAGGALRLSPDEASSAEGGQGTTQG
jgi:predicted type IV restriction endonuclease